MDNCRLVSGLVSQSEYLLEYVAMIGRVVAGIGRRCALQERRFIAEWARFVAE